MNENDLQDILAEICDEEKSELNKYLPFKPSLRHRIAMKRIFASFEENTRKSANVPEPDLTLANPRLRLGKRILIIMAAIICAALLTGFMTVFISEKIHGTVYSDHTQLFAVDTKNCPTTIECEYYLPELPEGFEMTEHDMLSFYVFTRYDNNISQYILLKQYAKDQFFPNYDNEHHDFEEIEVNGFYGVFIDYKDSYRDSEHIASSVVWDNGDYILQIDGNLSKDIILDLAKSTKVLEN